MGADTRYVMGDLSGIQDYVLGVRAEGRGQAKRLRARSFRVELFEHAALTRVCVTFALPEEEVLVRGGGGFLVRTDGAVAPAELDELQSDLQRQLYEESWGEVRVSLGWGATVDEARRQLEHCKRRPWASVLLKGERWHRPALHRPEISPPCPVCRHRRAPAKHGQEHGSCPSCVESSRLGERLTEWNWLRPVRKPNGESITALGAHFEPGRSPRPGAFRVRRTIPRHPGTDIPLTFEELALAATGTSRLAVLKADVDDMGMRVTEILREDRTLRTLRIFSGELHSFFSDTIQDLLASSWATIYTLFAGGDDLLLIGPWNVVFDFAHALYDQFSDSKGPGGKYPGLTFSAGIALTPYRVPVRHAVERAEELLESAKLVPGKNTCCALDATWPWARHRTVVSDGKRLARAIGRGAVSRSLVQRLLKILEPGFDPGMRAARWNYHVQRGPPGFQRELRDWTDRVDNLMDDPGNPGFLAQPAASIRYALLATRRPRKERHHAR